jgi:hypothetical protein
MKPRLMTSALLAMFALSACGSASDAVTFKAPPEFKPDVSIGPFAQTWHGPNHSAMMLMALPTKIDIEKRITNSPITNATIEHDRSITICGDQPARLEEMTGGQIQIGSPSPNREEPQQIDFLATTVNGKTYMAMYIRPLGAAADPAAEDALRHICPR